MNKLLFNKVKCSKFLKKVNDGRFIEVTADKDCFYRDTNNEKLSIECTYCGDDEFLKTYYEIKDRSFTGFVVGFKTITLSAYLCVDSTDFMGVEKLQLFVNPVKQVECAIVYYSNNRKSYVPIEYIKELEESDGI